MDTYTIHLEDLNPLHGDNRVFESDINLDAELSSIQEISSSINIDRIPFSRSDIVVIALAGIVGASFDLLSFLGNSTNNPIGRAGDAFHESVDHADNPLDFQGRVDINGNVIPHGDKTTPKAMSWAGGDHRGRTTGHDIAHWKEGVKMYEEGAFIDGGYPSGQGDIGEYIHVRTEVNQYLMPYPKLSHEDAVKAYKSHMWADFWSPKGLPLPFTSDLMKYCSDANIETIVQGFLKIVGKPLKKVNGSLYDTIRSLNGHEVRSKIQELYREGVNLRSELEKGLSFAIPEAIVQIYCLFEYKILANSGKRPEYSKEAVTQHRHLMLLITHSIVAAVNVGVAIVAENPEHLNLVTLARVFKLGLSCIKDEINYKHRVISKLTYDNLQTRVLEQKTLLAFANGYYETDNYQRFCDVVLREAYEKYRERLFMAQYLDLLIEEHKEIKEKQVQAVREATDEIDKVTSRLPVVVSDDESLENLVDGSHITEEDISDMSLKEYLNNHNEPEDDKESE